MRQLVPLLSICLILITSGFSGDIFAVEDKSANARMMQKAKQNGQIRVIVTSRLPMSSELFSENLQSKLNQGTSKLKSTQTFARASSRVFNHAPMVARSVGQSELAALLTDPTVRVFEDTLKRPMLEQSVARVYPSQSDSAFHGNNQWAVAILDTGVDKNHPFLANKVIAEACFSGGGTAGQSSLCPAGAANSIAANSALNCNLDGCEHGTQVAGVAVGDGANVDGVARDGLLIPIQVYSRIDDESFCFPNASCIGAFTSDIIAALEHVFALRNTHSIAAVNLSLGSDELFSGACDDQPERPIIDSLTAAGIAVVAAAGNSGNTSQMPSPACINSAIAVAATADDSDTPVASNNTSNQLDLFAPGLNINTSVPGGGFADAAGSSLAAPHVAGAWAVIKHASPAFVSVAGAEGLLKASGVNVTQNTVTRRRFDLTQVLEQLANIPQLPENDQLCFPLVSTTATAVVCL